VTILLLTQVLPYPPESGPQIKTWNLIKYLARHHAVTLIAFVRGSAAPPIEPLLRYCRAVYTVPLARGVARDAGLLLASVLGGQPFMIRRDERAAMRRMIAAVVAAQSFDAVHADQLNMAPYALSVRAPLRVLDAHNALWLVYRRLAARLPIGPRRALWAREWRALKRYEGWCARQFDRVLAVSDADRGALGEAMGTIDKIVVMPIAVDADEVRPLVRAADAERIVHLGTMFWPPNIDAVGWFADAILPLVRAERPQAEFDVIGARPARAVRALARRPGIRVTGYVADPDPYLRDTGAFVVPLRAGSGMRVKILTALAQGLPVVSTPIGCEGLRVEAGRDLLIAEGAGAFAAATLRVLGDRALADALGRNGRALIESTYDYGVAYRSLDEIYPPARRAA
jgi:glycosyltransferase involved in cell wall biosynthesis